MHSRRRKRCKNCQTLFKPPLVVKHIRYGDDPEGWKSENWCSECIRPSTGLSEYLYRRATDDPWKERDNVQYD